MKYFLSIILVSLALNIYSQKPEETEDWSRKPALVTPGSGTKPPSDAIILYNSAGDISKWESVKGGPVQWKAGNELTVVPKSGAIKTKQSFGNVQLHVEWKTPEAVSGEGQGRGNSGIFLMGLYEVQVLDSYNNETYYNGQAASIYKQQIPLVNASLGPGEWQTYDIFFTAPVFDSGKNLKTPGYITVVHNGVLAQDHVEIKGETAFIGKPKIRYHSDKLPLMLQEHSNPVSFRNIWIREVK